MTVATFLHFVNRAKAELTQRGRQATDLEIYTKASMDFQEHNTEEIFRKIGSAKDMQSEIEVILKKFIVAQNKLLLDEISKIIKK